MLNQTKANDVICKQISMVNDQNHIFLFFVHFVLSAKIVRKKNFKKTNTGTCTRRQLIGKFGISTDQNKNNVDASKHPFS